MNRIQAFVWNKCKTMPRKFGFVHINGSYAMIEFDFIWFSVFFGFRPWVEKKKRITWWGGNH